MNCSTKKCENKEGFPWWKSRERNEKDREKLEKISENGKRIVFFSVEILLFFNIYLHHNPKILKI